MSMAPFRRPEPNNLEDMSAVETVEQAVSALVVHADSACKSVLDSSICVDSLHIDSSVADMVAAVEDEDIRW